MEDGGCVGLLTEWQISMVVYVILLRFDDLTVPRPRRRGFNFPGFGRQAWELTRMPGIATAAFIAWLITERRLFIRLRPSQTYVAFPFR